MKRFVFIFSVILIAQKGFSQVADPVKWEYKVNMLNNCEAELVFTATVDTGWHLYSQKYVDGFPLFFEFENSTAFKKMGDVTEPEPIKEFDDLMGFNTFYFKESVIVFKQKIEILSQVPFKISGKLSGQVCKVHDGVCLALFKDFAFDVQICKKSSN